MAYGVRLGIDFGTSTTVAVLHVPGRDPRVLLFDGSPLLPSAVCVDPTGRLVVGRDALHTAIANPSAFEPHPKRCVDDGTVLLGDTELAVPLLFAAVLRRVLDEAAATTGTLGDGELSEVVLTCPAAWGTERRAVLLAAAPPGTRLVSEPVAAALYFTAVAGSTVPEGGTVVVYDFGAGTFDASVVRRGATGFEPVAARGRDDAGGLDIDAAVVAHLAKAMPDAERWDRLDNPRTPADQRARRQLWDNVRSAKEMLSRATTTMIHVPLFDTEVPLGREELDLLAAPVLERTVQTTREVLALAGVEPGAVAAVFLSGGSSRMPAVVTTLHRALGVTPVTVDQPELAVAEGCLRERSEKPAENAERPEGSPGADDGWPAFTPPLLSQPGRRRKVVVLAGATVALLALGTTAVLAMSPGDDDPERRAAPEQSVTPPPSPSPSWGPGIDPCLLGTWRVITSTVHGLISNVPTQYTGGAGQLITYRADGTSAIDYSQMQPRVAKVNGVVWADVIRGTATGRYTAQNGEIVDTGLQINAIGTLTRNGKFNKSAPITFYLEPTKYRCAGDTMSTFSGTGNFSDERTRVLSPSPNAAAGGE